MVERILITGANSPIGRYFLDELTHRYPGADFVGTYASSRPRYECGRVAWVQVDFASSPQPSTIEKLGSVDTMIHLASVTPGNNKSLDPSAYYRGNVAGVLDVLRALRTSGLQRIFYLSSTAVYNRTRGERLDELSDKSLDDAYGLSKFMFEHELAVLHQLTGLASFGLRVPVLLTKSVRHNFMSKWRDAIAKGDALSIANPDAPFNAVCPDFALLAAFEDWRHAAPTGCYVSNIFADRASSLREILDTIGYRNWSEVAPKAPAQLLETQHQRRFFPSYGALEVVRAFIT